jgi:hypothetical protein
MRPFSKLAVLLAVAGTSACSESATPLSQTPARQLPRDAGATIFDGAHAGAAYDMKFVFLPPMVKNPRDDFKSADGSLSPIVEVCELTTGNVCGRLVERFGPSGGTRTNENVRWLGNHYQVDFHAPGYNLDPARMHRVTVFVNGLMLGWADLVVGHSARDFNGVDGDAYVTMTTSQTLAIKFRIGNGIAAAIRLTPPSQTVMAGQPAQYSAAVTDLHGAALAVPVSWSSSDPSIASVDTNGTVTTYRAGTVTITASAERVSATATLVVTSGIARVVVDSQSMNIGNTRTLVARAYDAAGNLVTGQPVSWSVRATDGSLVRLNAAAGEVSGLAEGVALATASISGVEGSGPVTVSSNLEMPTICSGDGLLYRGSTTVLPGGDCGIRLTPAEVWTAGSAWSTTKQPVANGFEARFSMRLSSPGPADLLVQGNTTPGADGLVFVLQNMAGDAVGSQGVGVGYQGMTSSLAVEFDTWLNPGGLDPSSNHVSIHTNGLGPNHADETFSLGSAVIPGDLYDNQVHQVVVRYQPGTMTVRLDGVVILTVAVNLQNIGGNSILDAQGRTWAGFTSATGAAYGIHDVLSWFLYTPAP